MPPEVVAVRFQVSGAVQGVGYRAFTRRSALRLGLVGHAENLPDGRVEVVALGERAALAELEAILRRGPAYSRVDQVLAAEIPSDGLDLSSFVIG